MNELHGWPAIHEAEPEGEPINTITYRGAAGKLEWGGDTSLFVPSSR
jgi:hypothetical protein